MRMRMPNREVQRRYDASPGEHRGALVLQTCIHDCTPVQEENRHTRHRTLSLVAFRCSTHLSMLPEIIEFHLLPCKILAERMSERRYDAIQGQYSRLTGIRSFRLHS